MSFIVNMHQRTPSSLQGTIELTEAQVQDLLYLRRLFCGKIGQLGRSRKDLISKLPSENIGICHASDKLEEVTNLAEQLRTNGSEEYRTYMQFASSFYRGVSFLHICALLLVVAFSASCGPIAFKQSKPLSTEPYLCSVVMMTQQSDLGMMLCTL